MLPILLANCNYTYAVDKGLTMEFDFEGIQDTIIDQILFGKANILLQDWPYIVYRADASYSTKFSSLHAKIPQEPIPIKVQAQIIRDFPDLPDIYDAIDRLEIIVDFLLAVNEDKEKDLLQFMEKSIKMKTFSSATVLQFCKLKHVKALWSLLILDKSKRMHSSGKDAFDGLRDGLKIKIEDSSRKKFQQFLRKISKEKLNFLLQHIMDFILFFLNKEDMDEMQYSLKDAVIQYIQGNEYQDLPEDINDDLEEMSDDIIIKHVVDAWIIIFDDLQSREK
ncbi:E3 ubiquitin-protein ligase RNF213-like [Saccostrea cucullata]|uniref:E3 ubiquitin-protein ligase RNF213-like n=1 Tax=Saccostrea cuccullata TaxID=36930 RepID=UPI002ECFC92D